MQAGAVNVRYAEDKPESCDHCYFQTPKEKTCGLEECFYLLPEKEPVPETGTEGCGACPYGRDRPCIGFCIEKLLAEMRQKKSGEGGGADAG